MKTYIYILSSLLLISGVFYSCKKKQEIINNRVTPNNFLSGSKYDKLIIEIDYVTGYEPSDAAIQNVVSFLQSRINKSGGIEIQKSAISSGSSSSYNINDIRNFEKSNRQSVTNGSTLTAYALFLDKDFTSNSGSQAKVLGINYEPSSIVIFENTIRQYSGGITQPSVDKLETVVTEHEFGHVLGLTNNGTPMQSLHQDITNGAHCNNKKCLMHYAVETSDVIANLLGSEMPTLDNNCIADLRGNGGK